MTMQRLKAGVIGTTLLGVFSPLALAGTSVTIGPVDAASVAVPTMSSSLMIGLGLLLAIIALRALKQYGGAAKVLCLAIFGGGLVVGGIGIMNIMLVTVTERTREIGIRKALGATRLNILTQFLIESMVLCIIGGALGLALGSGTSMLLAKFAGWQTVVSSDSVITAFTFSALIGVFFGIWPAQRAARLNPIDALRHD